MKLDSSNNLRIISFDAIKALAIFLVLIIHVSAPGFVTFGPQWNAALVYESVSRISVPLFFMVTGALTLNKIQDVRSIIKRVSRLGIPLIAWSIIYLYFLQLHFNQHNPDWLKSIIQGPILHLWFIYAIVSIYIFLPLLSNTFSHATPSIRWWLIGFWFLGSSLIPTVNKLSGTPLIGFDLSYIPIYFGYLLLGATLHTTLSTITRRRALLLSGATWVTATFLTALFTWWKSTNDNNYTVIFFDYASPSVLVSSAGAFAFITALLNDPEKKLPPTIETIGSQTLNIYLVHMVPLNYITDYMRSHMEWLNPWCWYLVAASATLASTMLIVFVIQKIPILNRICPKN